MSLQLLLAPRRAVLQLVVVLVVLVMVALGIEYLGKANLRGERADRRLDWHGISMRSCLAGSAGCFAALLINCQPALHRPVFHATVSEPGKRQRQMACVGHPAAGNERESARCHSPRRGKFVQPADWPT